MKVLASCRPHSSAGMSLLLRAAGLFAGLLFTLGSTACGEWSQGGSVVEIESRFTAIGSAFPTTLLIPDRQGFQSRAFVQTASLPLGVFSFDLDAIAPPLPFEFFDLSKVLQGIPQDLVIEDHRDLAFVATSGESEGIWVFDPADAFQFLTSFTYSGSQLVLPNPAPDSDGKLVRFVKPKFTAGVALLQGKLYIPTSNLIQAGSSALTTVWRYRISRRCLHPT